jgi:hypothetical protein
LVAVLPIQATKFCCTKLCTDSVQRREERKAEVEAGGAAGEWR